MLSKCLAHDKLSVNVGYWHYFSFYHQHYHHHYPCFMVLVSERAEISNPSLCLLILLLQGIDEFCLSCQMFPALGGPTETLHSVPSFLC